ncbi:alpha/beta fold hydrolase [Marinomonas spartinae]|uniref:alpha/beta fold hydrolase n=1 Tax=Marinomonas spartinae TaxID=1792290 RepID=UPI001586DCA1|nr:alpha/beta hydrolase [Marinomonas spartinae]
MPQDQFISVNGRKIRYQDTGGEGPILLLTHGIGASLETWQEPYALLEKGNQLRVIVWDLPGHGLSDFGNQPYGVEDFAQAAWHFLDALNIDQPITLGGNSLGGAISIHMMNLRPDRVNKLALLNAASLGKESPLPFRLMSLPLLGELMNKPGKQAVDQQIQSIFYEPEKQRPKIEAVITRNVMRPGANKAFLSTLRLMTNFSGQRPALYQKTLSMLKTCPVPVLFVHGTHDMIISIEHTKNAQSITPKSSLLILEECGHTPQVETPEKVANVLTDLIFNQ